MRIMLFLLLLTSISAFAWDSKDPAKTKELSTHSLFAEQAFYILKNDLSDADKTGTFKQNLDILEQYLQVFKDGSNDADFAAKEHSLYENHFYDPTTQSNFTIRDDDYTALLVYVNDHALSSAQKFIGYAVWNWRLGKHVDAIYYLGVGVHFVEDLAQPMHASIWGTGGLDELDTLHTTFETTVEEIKENYRDGTLGFKTSDPIYQDTLNYATMADFMQKEVDLYAWRSHLDWDNYASNWGVFSLSYYDDTWPVVAERGTTRLQESVARVVYRFLKEVSASHNAQINTNTSFNVRIKTKDESYAGTDNNVYFGIEVDDGRYFEWHLDDTWSNDFERGDNDTYSGTIPGAGSSEIRRIWVRKENTLGISDDWVPQEVQLTAGSFSYTKTINQVINDHYGFYIDVRNNTMIQYPPANEIPNPTPGPDQVIVFSDTNYQGNYTIFHVGEFANLADQDVGNDAASSVKVGSNAKVAFYQSTNFSGSYEVITADDTSLSNNSIGDNTASSLKVVNKNSADPTGDSGSDDSVDDTPTFYRPIDRIKYWKQNY